MRCSLLAIVVSLAPWASAQEVEAPEPLPLERAFEATVGKAPRSYLLRVETPGVVFVAFRVVEGEELNLVLTDRFGQSVPGASMGAQRDDPHQQHLACSLVEAGDYRLVLRRFRAHDERTRARLIATFLPFDDVTLDRDTDAATPLEPVSLEAGVPLVGGLSPVDQRDWLCVESPATGPLSVALQSESDGAHALRVVAWTGEPEALRRHPGALWHHREGRLRLRHAEAGERILIQITQVVGSKPVRYTALAEMGQLEVEEED